MGFCMGVKRAVETAESMAEREDGRRVFTYGPLIHNPVVVNGLQERGVGVLAPGEPLESRCRNPPALWSFARMGWRRPFGKCWRQPAGR